jgi:outer membrane cobalamin receptor
MRHLLSIFMLLTVLLTVTRGQHIKPIGNAQTDTLPTFNVETVVVTADRQENKIANTTSSVSVINSDELRRLPIAKLSDAISCLPGFFVVNKDGLGRDPIVTSRGFYGGGEAEYLLVLLDGIPINDLETGLVNWNLIPIRSISSIEVSRGTSSPLYGDVALGGVMNILTHGLSTSNTKLSIEGGSYGILDGAIQHSGMIGSSLYNLSVANERTNGFRNHSTWKATTLNGNLAYPITENSHLTISANGQWVISDNPGPLTNQEIGLDREQSSPYYKADEKDENRQNLSLEYRYKISTTSEISSLLYYNRRNSNTVRTFVTPVDTVEFWNNFRVGGPYDTTLYGDAKERNLLANEYGVNLKYSLDNQSNLMRTRAIFGIDGSYGKLTSTYYNIFTGFEDDFSANTPARGTIASDGDASRGKFACYSSVEERFSIPLTISIGGRYDVMADKYDGRLPDTNFSINTSAVSLKYGANYKYVDADDFSGNVYVSFNRSFKAPTLDQLTDQRLINADLFAQFAPGTPYTFYPSEYPPFSNNALKPQTASSNEVGIYQKSKLGDGIFLENTVSYYKTDITDEIDFDLQTFRYRNIQNSRHVGIEVGTKLYLLPSVSGYFNYTWTSVKFASGTNQGNYLKSIPQNVFAAGLNYSVAKSIQASILWNFVNTTYMDDENTLLLGNFSSGNAKVSYLIDNVTFFLESFNILNKRYNSTGYLQYGTPFYLPSAGRTFHGGISVDL